MPIIPTPVNSLASFVIPTKGLVAKVEIYPPLAGLLRRYAPCNDILYRFYDIASGLSSEAIAKDGSGATSIPQNGVWQQTRARESSFLKR